MRQDEFSLLHSWFSIESILNHVFIAEKILPLKFFSSVLIIYLPAKFEIGLV